MPIARRLPERPREPRKYRLNPLKVPLEVRLGLTRETLEARLKQKRATIESYSCFLRENGLKANLSTLDLYISSLTGRLL